MHNSNEANFDKLIKILEYIYYKNNNITDENEQYYNIYSKYDINDLINQFNETYNEFNKNLQEILNSLNNKQNPLFNNEVLNEKIEKLNKWEDKCENYKNYFKKAKFLIIQILDKTMNENSMEIDDSVINTNNTPHHIWEQKKMLIEKKKVLQSQDLTLLNDNFGRALSSLECYANRYSKKRLSNVFNYYNLFNLGEKQDLNELKKKALAQTQIFRLAYDDYITKYKKYDPPQDLKLAEIKELLEKWKSKVDEESKIIYQGMINVIYSLDNSVFDKKFRAISQKYKNSKLDPKKISSFAAGIYYYNIERCNEAKKYYMKRGKLTSNLNINKKYTDDKNGMYLYKNIQNK